MIQYLIRRILLFIPTLLAITLIAFSLTRLAPGDPAALKAGISGEGQSQRSVVSKKSIEQWRKQMRLDQPVFTQYVLWLGDMLRLDFGKSFQDNRPVMEKISERLPVTVTMNIIAVVIAYAVAIPLGIASAARQGTFVDRAAGFSMFALYSLPIIWLSQLCLSFLCNPEYLYLFPNHGLHSNKADFLPPGARFMDTLWHWILPMVLYSYGNFAFLSRQMRSAMLETIRQDYIRTARAKGLSERTVIFKHTLRNSLLPIVTLLAGIIPALVGGSVVIEQTFSIPGMGSLSYGALVARDYPMIMAVFTIGAILTLLGILVSDILYSLIDPRIAFSKKS
jgi:peptide/nickel transport system permease protein